MIIVVVHLLLLLSIDPTLPFLPSLSTEVEEAIEPTYEDIQMLQLRRNQLEKWLPEPYFKEAVIGSFVRLNEGNRTDEQDRTIQVYKIAPIEGEEEEEGGLCL